VAHATDWIRLRELAEERRDRCALRLAEVTRRAQEAAGKLELLRDYRRDYLSRMGVASRNGIHGDGLRNYRTFLANLDQAIEQQGKLVAGIEREREHAQQALTVEQRAAHSYEILQQREAARASRRERREQQKQQDELATRPRPRFLTGAD
jgi:flagellar FliJ protein